jgi:hypothetical protein
MSFHLRRESPAWYLVLGVVLLAGCSTFTKQPDGTLTQDSAQVAMQKRIGQVSLLVAAAKGSVDALECQPNFTMDCLPKAKADEYRAYLGNAADALNLAQSSLRGAPCFVNASCTDAEMQATAEALGKAIAFVAKVTGALKT